MEEQVRILLQAVFFAIAVSAIIMLLWYLYVKSHNLGILNDIWLENPDKYDVLIGKEIADIKPWGSIHIVGIGELDGDPVILFYDAEGKWSLPLSCFSNRELYQMLEIINV